MGRISVVMAVYNAASTINKCLDALKWADEIIVMDTSSTDGTKAICSQYQNCKVIDDPCNDINLKRNKGYELAIGDWVLNLDADEMIPQALAKEIEEIISLSGPGYDGYFSSNREFLFGKWIYYVNGQKHRPQRYFLFKKGYLIWPGKRTHEMPQIKGRWGRLKNLFDHEPPNFSVTAFIRKIDNYTEVDMGKMTLDEARCRFKWHRMTLLPINNLLLCI